MEHALVVQAGREGVLVRGNHGVFAGSGEEATVDGGCRDGAGVHEGNVGHLSFRRTGAFAVGEVARDVTDGEAILAGNFTSAEARAAEGGTDACACGHERIDIADAEKFLIDGLAGGVQGKVEAVGSNGLTLHDGSHGMQVFEETTAAAGDFALVYAQTAIFELGTQVRNGSVLVAKELRGLLFNVGEQVFGVLVELSDGVGVARVEGQGDHRFDSGKIHMHNLVVPGTFFGIELLVGICAAVGREEFVNHFVCLPDTGEAGGFSGHDVDAEAVVHGEGRNAGANEFHDAVLHDGIAEHRTDDRDGNVVGANAGAKLAGEVDGDDFGHVHVPGVAEELLHKFAAAFTNAHAADGTIAGVAVGADDHLAAGGHLFTSILVDDGHVGGYKIAAIFFGGGKPEAVVVGVDGTNDGAKGDVAVREGKRNGEFFQADGASCLDDANVCDVVRHDSVETDAQLLRVGRGIVRIEDGASNVSRLLSFRNRDPERFHFIFCDEFARMIVGA